MRSKRVLQANNRMVNVVVVRNGRHSMALAVIVACLVSGLMGIFLPADSTSIIDRYIPSPWDTYYFVILLVSSSTILIGVWLPDFRDRVMIEQIGLWFLSGVLLVYPAVVWTKYAHHLELGGMISLLCGIGGLARIAEILHELRRLRRYTRESS